MDQSIEQFDFGENWKNFSEKALTPEKRSQSLKDFEKLIGAIEIKDKLWLDIGFGQGLGLLNATLKGAKTFGNDINPKCAEVLTYNQQKFSGLQNINIPTVVGSILADETISKIHQATGNQLFDVVHSWGVLHHTGQMWEAISKATELVKQKGYFILAIYNKHWTSPIWLFIKWLYTKSPSFFKKVIVYLFVPIFWLRIKASGIDTAYRGMDFYHDVVDWVGGYPYEYADKNEIESFLSKKGFILEQYIPTQGFTGCNEFVFRRL
jgi:SAM-dependent methyltransferase